MRIAFVSFARHSGGGCIVRVNAGVMLGDRLSWSRGGGRSAPIAVGGGRLVGHDAPSVLPRRRVDTDDPLSRLPGFTGARSPDQGLSRGCVERS